MALNHVPSDLHVLTDRSLGIFSAAEGFVFLAGLLAGIVYTRRLRDRGADAVRSMTTTRAATIYGWHMATFVACMIAVHASDRLWDVYSPTAPALFHDRPFLAMGLGALLLYQPGWLDILPMYCGMILLVPIVLNALENRQRWTVLAVSFLLWLAVQLSPPLGASALEPINMGAFNFFAWQFLFVLGLFVGHDRASQRAHARRHPRRNFLVITGALALAVYAWGLHQFHWPHPWSDRVFGILLNKPALGWLRLGDFLLVAYLISVVGSAWPNVLEWKPLAFLGRYPLSVFAVQTVVVVAMMQFPKLFDDPTSRAVSNLALIATLFLAAFVHDRYANRRRQSTRHPSVHEASPARPELSSPALSRVNRSA
jgi:hypothetical protein